MIHYSGEDFDSLIKEGTVLVDFYADWCGPCKMLSTVLEDINDKDIRIIKVNVDEYNDLATRFRIMSIPHIIIYKNGKEVSNSIGFIDKTTLLEKIEEAKMLK